MAYMEIISYKSEILVIIFYKDYASSTWCLDELTKILKCKGTKGQRVSPLFYNIDPSKVRHQTNNFGKPFAKHEKRFKDDRTKVESWKTVLQEVS
jgi:hypothetical protein